MNDELRKAAQDALAAMEKEWGTKLSKGNAYSFMKAARALRAALSNNAAPESQPVAWMGYSGVGEKIVSPKAIYSWMTIPLYTAPVPAPQREWQSLTEVEICDCIYKAGKSFAAHQKGIKGQQLTFADSPDAHLAWALERVLKEKNHG